CLRQPMQVAPRSLYRPMRIPRRRSPYRGLAAAATVATLILMGSWLSREPTQDGAVVAKHDAAISRGANGPSTEQLAAAQGEQAAMMPGSGDDASAPADASAPRPDARLVSASKSTDTLRTVLLPEGTVARLKPGELDGIETVRAE